MEWKVVTRTAALLIFACILASAQDEHKFNFNVGGGVGIPIGTTGDLAGTSGNLVIGGGYNFKPAFGFVGEFMWHNLPPTNTLLNSVSSRDGSARLYSLTGNFIVRVGKQRRLGAYVIGGGGWYHRSWEITAPTVVPGTVCLPSYFWLGLACVNGLVPANAVLHDGSANGGGVNIGGGITLGREGPGPKFYTEVRYHRAFLPHFDTEVLPVTFGIRW